MKGFLSLSLTILFVIAFSSTGSAQRSADTNQTPDARSQAKSWAATHTYFCWGKQGAWFWSRTKLAGPEYSCAGPYESRLQSTPTVGAEVVEIDPRSKTITVAVKQSTGRPTMMTLSAAKLDKLPKVGSIVDLMEHPARFIFKTCEECNAVCPGVCFLGPDSCRCYLFHLRTQ
jgi:hypothetical protein